MAQPDSFYRAAERRIEYLIVGLGGVLSIFAAAKWGWRAGAGVGLGVLLAWINYRWLKQGVEALVTVPTEQAGSEHARVPFGVYLKFFGRFALLLVVVYVILSRSILPAASIIGGLFVLVGAVMLEVIMELVRGKRGT